MNTTTRASSDWRVIIAVVGVAVLLALIAGGAFIAVVYQQRQSEVDAIAARINDACRLSEADTVLCLARLTVSLHDERRAAVATCHRAYPVDTRTFATCLQAAGILP